MKCPQCGYEIETRAELGAGTQRCKTLKKCNFLMMALLKISRDVRRPLKVRDMQRYLYGINISRNYHRIQADLSCLVGKDLITCTRAQEYWAEDRFKADPTPVYYLDKLQLIRLESIIENKGSCEWLKPNQIRPPEGRGPLFGE